MTDDERALLLEVTTMVVNLLKGQYADNLKVMNTIPASEESVGVVNEIVLDRIAHLCALQAKVKEPGLPVDMSLLMDYAKNEVRRAVQKDVSEAAEILERNYPDSDYGDRLKKDYRFTKGEK